jgi:hypothetical protein
MPTDEPGTVGQAPSERDLILRLRLEPGEAVKGSVGPEPGGEAVEFHGWIDFMAAIDHLRAQAVLGQERPVL